MTKALVHLIVLGFLAGLVSGFLLPSVFADEAADIASFKAAYSAYQQYIEAEDYERALPEARSAYEIGRSLYGDDSPNTASLAYNYGLSLIDVGEGEQAKDILRETLVLYQNVYGKDSPKLVSVLMDFGKASIKVYEPDHSSRYFKRALKITRNHYGEDSVEYGRHLLQVGIAEFNIARSAKAKRYLEQAYENLHNNLGDEDPTTGLAAFQLARFEFVQKDYSDAEGHLLAALKTFEDPERPSSAVEMSTHAWLVSVYEELGSSDKATEHCLAIGRMTPYEEDQEYFPLYRKEPTYPKSAQLRGKEGYVDLNYTVDQEGIVRDVQIENGDSVFREASIEAVNQWRFAPRFVDGQPVATTNVRTRLTYQFAE